MNSKSKLIDEKRAWAWESKSKIENQKSKFLLRGFEGEEDLKQINGKVFNNFAGFARSTNRSLYFFSTALGEAKL